MLHLAWLISSCWQREARRGEVPGEVLQQNQMAQLSQALALCLFLQLGYFYLLPPLLGPICTFLFLHVWHVVFQLSFPRQSCLCCRVPHSELSRPGDGTPLDFLTILLRRAEIPKTASWEGKSSMLSFQVVFFFFLELLLPTFACPFPSQAGSCLSSVPPIQPLLTHLPKTKGRAKGISYSLLLSSMNHEKENPHKIIIPLL